jgi:hypothetical protein
VLRNIIVPEVECATGYAGCNFGIVKIHVKTIIYWILAYARMTRFYVM